MVPVDVRKFKFRHDSGLENLIVTGSHVTAAVSLLNALYTAGQSRSDKAVLL